MLSTRLSAVAIALPLLACAAESVAPLPTRRLTVHGAVFDSSGRPVPGAYVQLNVLPHAKSWSTHWFDNPRTWTDEEGRFTLSQDTLPEAAFRALVSIKSPGCTGRTTRDTIHETVIPPLAEVTVTRRIEVPSVEPRASIAAAQACAWVNGLFGPGSAQMRMIFDSTSGALIWGRWEIGHYWSSIGPDGTFIGVSLAGRIGFTLTRTSPADVFGYSTCPEFSLSGSLNASREWTTLRPAGSRTCLEGDLFGQPQFSFAHDTLDAFTW